MVSFKKVRKAYGELVVLDNLDLDVAPGEMVSIIGPSGSGKTTVLRMLMTLEEINGGVIYVDGNPLTHMPKNGKLVPASQRHLRQRRADIGMCFQSFTDPLRHIARIGKRTVFRTVPECSEPVAPVE